MAVGPDTLYAATVPGLPVVPVIELKRLQLVPSVEAATQAVYWSQTAMQDWMVYVVAWRRYEGLKGVPAKSWPQ